MFLPPRRGGRNKKKKTFSFTIVSVDGEYLCGELRAEKPQKLKYHIFSDGEHFVRENDAVFRCGKVIRQAIDKTTGNTVLRETIRVNHAKVMYDTDSIPVTSDQAKRILK